ncbi:hypothetical protein [Moorena producens]|uniref:hypothetical protein n=1 Tax=Moorena producens TaxID=1155739 RepID=UPI0011EA6B6D|nr:hypothetical protein [Moorena producens]
MFLASHSRLPNPLGCICFLLFDPMVRYGAGYLNTGLEAENEGEPAPNAPYATPYSLLPTPYSLSYRFLMAR